MNTLRTAMLLAAMTALFMGVGFLIGGSAGMVIAFVDRRRHEPVQPIGTADKMVLSMHRAREVDERAAPELYALVRQLAAARRTADAAGLSDRQPAAERLRHRPQSRRTPPSR